MGSVKKVFFIYLQKKKKRKRFQSDWRVKRLNDRGKETEERAEMRGGENESGVEEPLMGAVSSHVIPLIAF